MFTIDFVYQVPFMNPKVRNYSVLHLITILSILYTPICFGLNLGKSQIMEFQFEGETLNGILNQPEQKKVKGIVLLIHGYGETYAVQNNWYADIRAMLLEAGFATYMWDKIGCGESTGSFDINQPVDNSADEAIAAIAMLQKQKVTGADTIGLWGGSRAGWINPLVIKKHRDISFWVSVSGVDGKENFRYLLEKNLIIEGLSESKAKLIASEWQQGMLIAHQGGSYWDYKAATKNLSNNDFWLRFSDGGYNFFNYYFLRYSLKDSVFDESSGLMVHVENFESLLSNLNIPVLALFGELDMNVDWRQTKALYENTIDDSLLTVVSFANCNHSIVQAETGGFYEFQDSNKPQKRCVGFLDSASQWLTTLSLQ